MGMEKQGKRILEWLHPAILLSLALPFVYLFYEERTDRNMLPLYLGGFVILVCTVPTRIAAQKVGSLWGYLLVGGLSAAATLGLARLIGNRLFGGGLSVAYLVEIGVWCLWIVMDSGRIRMREKGRKKAVEENDTGWQGDTVILERPAIGGLPVFAAAYIAGLLRHCGALCDIALVGGLLYLLLYLAYRHIVVTEYYFTEVKRLVNVPKRKLRRMRTGVFLLLVLAVCAASIPSLLSMPSRAYPEFEWIEFSPPEEEVESQPFQPSAAGGGGGFPEWMEESAPHKEPPWWMEYVTTVLLYIVVILVAYVLFRVIRGFFLEFRGAPEENGDVAEELEEEDEEQRIRRPGRGFRLGGMTERERIRKNYRRMIRKYRKDSPGESESPEEIEAGAEFPEGYDLEALHESYEQARYGK